MGTYVNNLRLLEITTGAESGTWGTKTNTNLELIADAFGSGTEAIITNADTHTTTIADGAADEGRAIFLKYTGTLDSACTITIAPNTVNKLWLIENATSGSQNIIISQGSGANITIGNGKVAAVYTDGAGSGAAVLDAFADLELSSTLTVAGASTLTGAVTMSGDASVGDDLSLASDAAVLNFGADSDVSLTHVADTGLLLNSTRQLQFFDASQRIAAVDATTLSIGATDEIDLTATALDLNGNVDISGTTTLGSDLSVPATNKILLDGGDNTYIQESSADVLQVVVGGNDAIRIRDSANDVNIQTLDLTVDATQKIYLDGGGNTYLHESTGDTIQMVVGGVSHFQVQGDGVIIPSAHNLYLDGGGNTYITEGSADVMRFFAGGAKQFEVTGTNMSVVGALSKGSGSFRIDHPLDSMKDTHDLVHSFIEGPRADLMYRGSVQLSGGTATVDLDAAATMTDGTWELLCRDPQVWVQNEDGWTQVRGSVSGSTLTITAQDGDCTDTVSWLVVAERQDEHMMDTNWTDNNGRVIVEPEKPAEDEEEAEDDGE